MKNQAEYTYRSEAWKEKLLVLLVTKVHENTKHEVWKHMFLILFSKKYAMNILVIPNFWYFHPQGVPRGEKSTYYFLSF